MLKKGGVRTGIWHYTRMNDRKVWPVGYCAEGGPEHEHKNEQEARECFGRYLLDGAHEETYADWTGCHICDEPTKKGMAERQPLGQSFPLCSKHCTKETLSHCVGLPVQMVASY